MPLPLADPRWSELHGCYNGTDDAVAWLTEAYEQGGLSDERLGDLINEVQHQGDKSTAMSAVATHLIELARRAPPADALVLPYKDASTSSKVYKAALRKHRVSPRSK